ncbi:MAG: hypothetical protein RMN53_17610 [Anaerolineae bacterium]|nr:hypothetical protein [Anaerolineae bacterium]
MPQLTSSPAGSSVGPAPLSAFLAALQQADRLLSPAELAVQPPRVNGRWRTHWVAVAEAGVAAMRALPEELAGLPFSAAELAADRARLLELEQAAQALRWRQEQLERVLRLYKHRLAERTGLLVRALAAKVADPGRPAAVRERIGDAARPVLALVAQDNARREAARQRSLRRRQLGEPAEPQRPAPGPLLQAVLITPPGGAAPHRPETLLVPPAGPRPQGQTRAGAPLGETKRWQETECAQAPSPLAELLPGRWAQAGAAPGGLPPEPHGRGVPDRGVAPSLPGHPVRSGCAGPAAEQEEPAGGRAAGRAPDASRAQPPAPPSSGPSQPTPEARCTLCPAPRPTGASPAGDRAGTVTYPLDRVHSGCKSQGLPRVGEYSLGMALPRTEARSKGPRPASGLNSPD